MEQFSDNSPELLAPAGDFDALKYAIAGGANAVYLGLTDFNARSKAKNFTKEELRLAILYCHDRGVRVYLTLNTLVKDKELPAALETAAFAFDSGVDGVLVQDIPLLFLLKKELPKLPIHASTQMGIHNKEGAEFAHSLGVDRVVLSRETLPSDIKKITEAGIETEFFVHGAMCVSFSGNCYFSSIVSGYSGNRGKCLQLCRKKYILSGAGNDKQGFMLSPKDICMYPVIDKLKNLGIKSYKIEGRLRSKEYAYEVSRAYSRALIGEKRSGDIDRLKTVFNRGDFGSLYMKNDKADIIYEPQQNNIGLNIGRITSLKPFKISGKYQLNVGDGVKFFRKDKEVGGGTVTQNGIAFTGNANIGDSVSLTKSLQLSKEAEFAVRADNRNKLTKIEQLYAENDSVMSDITDNFYDISEKAVIIKVNERTDTKLFALCDVVIYSPMVYNLDAIISFKQKINKPVLLDMPTIARDKDIDVLKEIISADVFDGYIANNIYALQLCRGKKIVIGSNMNFLSSAVNAVKISSIESAVIGRGDIVYAFGKYSLMNFSHCPRRQLGQTCGKCTDKQLHLQDESRNVFQLMRKKLHYCYFEMLNCKITNLLGKIDNKISQRILIDCTNVSEKQAYDAITMLEKLEFDQKQHTVGRFGKGVK